MLERLGFSIPMSATINAPADLVWETLTDVASHPATFNTVLAARPLYHGGGVSGNNHGSFVRSRSSLESSSPDPSSGRVSGGALSSPATGAAAFQGSKWNITRISVVENQKYSAQVTITQCNQEENRRSFTMSTHQMLGATCSLKLTVEPVAGPLPNNDNDSHRNSNLNSHTRSATTPLPSQEPPPDTTAAPSRTPPPSTACCHVTAIMTMIPFRIFVKLLGVACCICFLKRRARMAMECDLEDLTTICEKQHAESTAAAGGTTAAATALAGGTRDREGESQASTFSLLQQAAENEADAESSSSALASGS